MGFWLIGEGSCVEGEVRNTSILKTEFSPVTPFDQFGPLPRPEHTLRAALCRGSGFVVCPACSIAGEWKSPVQPDGGEGL